MDERQIKHLEMIQGVVTRFGTNSFFIKGWCLTVSVALYGFTVNHLTWKLALVALFPPIPFWYLDAYFLYHERLFRCLYDDVRRSSAEIEPFSMHIGAYKGFDVWRKAALSITLGVFYGTILAVGLVIFGVSVWPD